MNYHTILKIVVVLASVALIVYFIISPVNTLMKIAWINAILFLTTQVLIFGKKQYKLPNKIWLASSFILLTIWVLAETGSI